MAPPREDPRSDSAGDGGDDDGGIDVEELAARLDRVERRQKQLIQLHRRLGTYSAGEFSQLLDD